MSRILYTTIMTTLQTDNLLLREPKLEIEYSSEYSLFPELISPEKNGVVYTKPWVVELILNLAGYNRERDLALLRAVEPAAGEGAFLLPMVRRLIASCRLHAHPIQECGSALLAYELDEASVARVRNVIQTLLCKEAVSEKDASLLARQWVRTGDYLLDATSLPTVDFVIGNPPYIRLEEINQAVAVLYRDSYRTMVGRADIYVAFFEAALKQLNPDGVCAFICADRWMLNQYGAELRRLVTTSYGVEAVIEMHNADAFEAEVSAYPAITIIRRAKQGTVIVAGTNSQTSSCTGEYLAQAIKTANLYPDREILSINGLKMARVPNWFQGSDPWPCVSPERLALLKRLEAAFAPLESKETQTVVGIGVATGCDDVFITKNPSIVEPTRMLPLAMSSDAKEGRFTWSKTYLINPWCDEGLVSFAEYPRLEAYFKQHQQRLKARNVGKRNPERWYRTIDRVNYWLLPKSKLYFPDIKNRIYPVLDRGETYPHHNLYFVQSDTWDMEVLGGLLLSRVAQFFVECYGVRMRGGYLRFQAQYLRRIRVPDPNAISEEQAHALREAFHSYDVEKATEVAFELYAIDSFTGEILGY